MLEENNNNSNNNSKLQHVKNKLRSIALRANNRMTLNLQTIDYVARMNQLFDKFLEEELLLLNTKTTTNVVMEGKKKRKKQKKKKTPKDEVVTTINDDVKEKKNMKENENVAAVNNAAADDDDDSCDVRKIIENRRQKLLINNKETPIIKKVAIKVQNFVDGTCERVPPCKNIRSRRCHRRRHGHGHNNGNETDHDDGHDDDIDIDSDEELMMDMKEAEYMKQVLNEFLQEVHQNDNNYDDQKANNVDIMGSSSSANMMRLGSTLPSSSSSSSSSSSIQKTTTASHQEQHLPLKERFQHFLQRRSSTTSNGGSKKKNPVVEHSSSSDDVELHNIDDDPDHGMTNRMKDILSKFLESQDAVATAEEAATTTTTTIAEVSDTADVKGGEQDTTLDSSDSASPKKTIDKTTKKSTLLDSSTSTMKTTDSLVKKSRPVPSTSTMKNQSENTANTKTLEEDGGKSLLSSKETSSSSFLPSVGRRGSKNDDGNLVLLSSSPSSQQQNREEALAAVAGPERVMGVATSMHDNWGWFLLVVPLLLLYALAVFGFLRKKRKVIEMAEENDDIKQNIRSLFASPSCSSPYSCTVPEVMELVDGETPSSSRTRRTIYSYELMEEMSGGNPPSDIFRKEGSSPTTITEEAESESQSSRSSNTITTASRKDIAPPQTRQLEREVVPSRQFATSPSSVDSTVEQPPTLTSDAAAENAVPKFSASMSSVESTVEEPPTLTSEAATQRETVPKLATSTASVASATMQPPSLTPDAETQREVVPKLVSSSFVDSADSETEQPLTITANATTRREVAPKRTASTSSVDSVVDAAPENVVPKSQEGSSPDDAILSSNSASGDVLSARDRKRVIEDFARRSIRLHAEADADNQEPMEAPTLNGGSIEDDSGSDSLSLHRWKGTVSVPIPDDDSCESSLTSSLAPPGVMDGAESRSYDAEDESVEGVPDTTKYPLGSQRENLLRFGMSFGRLLFEAEEEMAKLEDEEDPELEYEIPKEKYQPSDASMRLNVNLEELLAEGEDEKFDAGVKVSGFGNRSVASFGTGNSRSLASFGMSVKKLIRETETTLSDLHIEEESSVDSRDIESKRGQPVTEKTQTDSVGTSNIKEDNNANFQLRGDLDAIRRESMLGFGMSFARLLQESEGMMDDVPDEEDPEDEYEVECNLRSSPRRKSSILLGNTLSSLLTELSSDGRLFIEGDSDDDHVETEAEDSLMPLPSRTGTRKNGFMDDKGQETERKKSDGSATTRQQPRRSVLRKEKSLRFEASLEKLLEETEEGVFGRSSSTLNLTGGVHTSMIKD